MAKTTTLKARGRSAGRPRHTVKRLVVAGAAAGAVLAAPALTSEVAQAAGTAGAAEAVPAVLVHDVNMINWQERKDRRARRTGVDLVDGYIFVWGLNGYGAYGGPSDYRLTDEEFINSAPALVDGIPQGAMADVAATGYEYVGLEQLTGNPDVADGCLWGWGRYGAYTGTGYGSSSSVSLGGKTVKYWSTPAQKIAAYGISANIESSNLKGQKVTALCNVVAITASDSAGAAIDRDGTVWSWGDNESGGPWDGNNTVNTANEKKNYPGAQKVVGLPAVNDDAGTRPVAIEGGYGTFWVLLANGEVYYFGHSKNYERPANDEPAGKYSGNVKPNMNLNQGTPKPVTARKSQALQRWFRNYEGADSKVPTEGHIVQVHSGDEFGAALLSTGRVLTWGNDEDSALGRDCVTGYKNGNAREVCARTPAYAVFPEMELDDFVVSLSCGYAMTAALTSKGDLYAWAASDADIRFRDVSLVSAQRMARNVTNFQVGEAYLLYWMTDAAGNEKVRGVGFNMLGALGHVGGNYGTGTLNATLADSSFNEDNDLYTKDRPVWFAAEQYNWCVRRSQQRFPGQANDLGKDKSVNKIPVGWYAKGNDYWYNIGLDADTSNDIKVFDGTNTKGTPGEFGDYTTGEYILFRNRDGWPATPDCTNGPELNDTSKWLTFEYCVAESISWHKSGYRRTDGKPVAVTEETGYFVRPCSGQSIDIS
ncbi:MAG: hypothetical protein LBD51_07130 [Bifidobacteriaceae bacterium]|nr:hypothetical protein [Bifidobacteriaceae bacterium]